LLGGFYGLIDQRKGGIWGLVFAPGQRQHTAQQRINRRGWRLAGQQTPQRFGSPQIAQHVKAQGLHAWTQIGINFLQAV